MRFKLSYKNPHQLETRKSQAYSQVVNVQPPQPTPHYWGQSPSGRSPSGQSPSGRSPSGRSPSGQSPSGRSYWGRTGWVCLVLSLLLAGGCVYTPIAQSPELDLDLLHGVEAFGYEITPAPIADVLNLSTEMRAFLHKDITAPDIAYTRFRRLMLALQDGGHFANSYTADGTYSAAQTFANGQGNCLGYTNMFIALARGAGLDARYQLIEHDPNWNVKSGYLVKNNHVNVVVNNVRLSRFTENEVIVDFNMVRPDPEYSTAVEISDEYAAALFYANLGVQYLHEGEFEDAFAQLKRGAMTEPMNKMVWNNLGVLLSKFGKPELAQRAYEQVMRLDPEDKTAWVGMAVTLRAQGLEQEALSFNQKVEHYQTSNPYYHFALAEAAFSRQKFKEALDAVELAIDMRRREPSFWHLRAAAATELGELELAARSERRATRYAEQKTHLERDAANYRYD